MRSFDRGATSFKMEEFRKLMHEEWDPGLNAPFDPVAAEEAQEANMEVAIIGADLAQFEAYLSSDQPFKGTLISN